MAQKLTSKERLELAMTFLHLDDNGDNVLSREEVATWLRNEGYKLKDQEIEKVFRTMDENADGRVSLDEFLNFNALLRQQFSSSRFPTHTSKPSPPAEAYSEERLIEIFNEMDVSGDGRLSNEELLMGLVKTGHGVTEENLPKLISNLDKSRDGKVNYRQFVENCKKLVKQASKTDLVKN